MAHSILTVRTGGHLTSGFGERPRLRVGAGARIGSADFNRAQVRLLATPGGALGALPTSGAKLLEQLGLGSVDLSKLSVPEAAAIGKLQGAYAVAYSQVARITAPGMQVVAKNLLEKTIEAAGYAVSQARSTAGLGAGDPKYLTSFPPYGDATSKRLGATESLQERFEAAVASANSMVATLVSGIGTTLAAPFKALIAAAQEVGAAVWQAAKDVGSGLLADAAPFGVLVLGGLALVGGGLYLATRLIV